MKLEKEIIVWAAERGIFQKATPIKQAYKTLEECGELIAAIAANDRKECRDAIGDVMVTLIIQCEMQGFKLEDCLEMAYHEIKDRRGTMQNGTFVKEVQNG